MALTRREALAALTSLPAVSRIASVPAESNDVIVVECDCLVSSDEAGLIKNTMKQIWPDRQVVVCSAGLRLKVAPH